MIKYADDKRLHVLVVASSAPPKNSPEAMQVSRFLAALDPAVRVTLVTTPIVEGWEREDASLSIQRPGMQVIVPELPVHRLTQRVLGNHRLAALHVPDSDFWFPWYANQVVERLDEVPDVIYSRSAPFSSALLAKRLKHSLGRPWMMHFSDPWAGSPYRPMSSRRAGRDYALEADCIGAADLIALTTEGQAEYYRTRYPERAQSIIVTPNMMVEPAVNYNAELHAGQRNSAVNTLTLVHTGALYGDRNPTGLLQALCQLRPRIHEFEQNIHVQFIGNMSSEMAKLIDSTPFCTRRPSVSFEQATIIQSQADILVSIEPQAIDPLYNHFLLSKVVDYLATGRPILALTPPNSLTSTYCQKGYGWSFEPNDVAGIANFLEGLMRSGKSLSDLAVPPPPIELESRTITRDVMQNLQQLIFTNKNLKVPNAT